MPNSDSSESPRQQGPAIRRWFQFNLRHFLFLLTLIAVVTAAFIHLNNQAVLQAEAVKAIDIADPFGGAAYFYESDNSQQSIDGFPVYEYERLPKKIGWLEQKLGGTSSKLSRHWSLPITANLKKLHRWPSWEPLRDSLKYLDISANQFDDLGPVEHLRDLESLNLAYTKVADLSPISGLSKLKYLNL